MALGLLLFAVIAIATIPAISSTADASSHTNLCTNADNVEEVLTDTIYVDGDNVLADYVIDDSDNERDTGTCLINIDESPTGISDLSTIEEAIIAADYGGEVIIREKDNFDPSTGNYDQVYYDGFVMGTEQFDQGILEDGKEITIKGEEDGIVALRPNSRVVNDQSIDNAPISIIDNEHQSVTVENVILGQGKRAANLKSRSNLLLKDVSMDSSLESARSNDISYIFMERNLGTDDQTGGILRTGNVYYPEDSTVQTDDIVQTNSDQGILETSDTDQEPDLFIYNQISDQSAYNPVTAGDYGSYLYVNNNSGDDDKIATPYETISSAAIASQENAVIEIEDTGNIYDSGPSFSGVNIDEQNSIRIKGRNGVPEVDQISINHEGRYNLENIQVTSELSVSSQDTDIRADEVYWNIDSSSVTPEIIESERVDNTGGSSTLVTVEPWCEDESCNNLVYNQNFNPCIVLKGGISSPSSVNCNSDTQQKIEIGLDYDKAEDQDVRQGDIYVRDVNRDINDDVDVELSVTQSDSIIEQSTTLYGTQLYQYEDFTSTFSEYRSSVMSDSVEFTPSGTITLETDSQGEITFPYKLDKDISFNSDNNGSETDDSSDSDGSTGSIIDGSYEGIVDAQETLVTRFNAGESESSFEDNAIPPRTTTDNIIQSTAVGELKDFEQARIENGRPATILPKDSVNIGLSYEGIPSTQYYYLNITYAYQADPADNIDIKITDRNGDQLYTARPDEIEQLEPTSNSDISEGESESEVTTSTLTIPLHELESEYIRETGNIYVTIEDESISTSYQPVLLLYNSKILSTDRPQSNQNNGSNSNTTGPIPGDIDVSVNVLNGEFNSEYQTYDINPNSDLRYEIILENTGDQTIEGSFEITDRLERTAQTTTIGSFNKSLSPGETSVEVREKSWDESQYGNHNIRITRQDISSDNSRGFDAYVLQDATPEIAYIDTPQEHVTYDNFNAEVGIRNTGDLQGQTVIESEFGSWYDETTVELPSGDSRSERGSEIIPITYSRSDHPSTGSLPNFSRREYTVNTDVLANDTFELNPIQFDQNGDNNYYRPNAPFHTETGEHNFRAIVSSLYDGNQRVVDSQYNRTRLYELQLTDFKVDTNPQVSSEPANRPTENEATIYASAWPYTYPSLGQSVAMRQYDESEPVLEGNRILFGSDNPSEQPLSRVSLPLNEPNIDYTSEPTDMYFSNYFSHHVRNCNRNLLEDGQSTQIPEDEANEGDTQNVFIPFSASSCSDETRYTRVHAPRFVGTTDDTETDTRFSSDSSSSTTLTETPSGVTINGVNPDTFETIDNRQNVMMAHVTLSNPGDSQSILTGRIEIVTDRELEGSTISGIGKPNGGHQEKYGTDRFDDNVIGAAAVRMKPTETETFRVPIVIRNNDDIGGIHNISVRFRSDGVGTEDYINASSIMSLDGSVSPITGVEHNRATIPINVETYGDAVLEKFEPADNMPTTTSGSDPRDAQEADAVAYSVCDTNSESLERRADGEDNFRSNIGMYTPDTTEGLNPQSGSSDIGVERDDGDCNNVSDQQETVSVEATYTNYGGETIEIEPNVIAEKVSRSWQTRLHRQSGHTTGDRLFEDYSSDPASQFDGETWSSMSVKGQGKISGQTVNINPGQTKTVVFERKFQEPGLYQLRVSPCRDVSSSGPQDYNMEGFTGIPDVTQRASGFNPSHLTVARHGIDRISDSVSQGDSNQHTTPEMRNSLFHGTYGCANQSTSVFVFDTTEPTADFSITESKSARKLGRFSADSFRSELVSQVDNVGAPKHTGSYSKSDEWTVYEGGLLVLDGSTYNCPSCYRSPTITPDDNVINPSQRTSKSYIRNSQIQSGDIGYVSGVKQYPLSQSNTVVTDMNWQIGGDNPNDGQEISCQYVNDASPDEECYMEQYISQNYYENVVHRFNQGDQIQLTVQDDTRLTEGASNSDTTTKDVDVIPAKDLRVDLRGYSVYDLNYGCAVSCGSSSGPYTVQFNVVDSEGNPLQDVSIDLSSSSGTSYELLTGADGEASAEVNGGEYNIIATSNNSIYENTRQIDKDTQIDITLAPTGSVNTKVMNTVGGREVGVTSTDSKRDNQVRYSDACLTQYERTAAGNYLDATEGESMIINLDENEVLTDATPIITEKDQRNVYAQPGDTLDPSDLCYAVDDQTTESANLIIDQDNKGHPSESDPYRAKVRIYGEDATLRQEVVRDKDQLDISYNTKTIGYNIYKQGDIYNTTTKPYQVFYSASEFDDFQNKTVKSVEFTNFQVHGNNTAPDTDEYNRIISNPEDHAVILDQNEEGILILMSPGIPDYVSADVRFKLVDNSSGDTVTSDTTATDQQLLSSHVELGDNSEGKYIWHRYEGVIDEYRSPNNHLDAYGNTFEGTRTCLTSHRTNLEEQNIGVSQEAWYRLDIGTHVIDSGYVKGSNGYINDLETQSVRSGDERCMVFEEGDDRVETFSYSAWNFGMNEGSDDIDVKVTSSDTEPTNDFRVGYGNKKYHEDNPDFIWAAEQDTNFNGGQLGIGVRSRVQGEDNVGIACIDVRVYPDDGSCQEVDGSSTEYSTLSEYWDTNRDYELPSNSDGRLPNRGSIGGLPLNGADSGPSESIYNNAYTAKELNIFAYDNYQELHSGDFKDSYPPQNVDLDGGVTSLLHYAYVTDWHSNTNASYETTSIAVDDGTPPIDEWSVEVDGGSSTQSGRAYVGGQGTFEGNDVRWNIESRDIGGSVSKPIGFYQIRSGWGVDSQNNTIDQISGNGLDYSDWSTEQGDALSDSLRGSSFTRLEKEQSAQDWGYYIQESSGGTETPSTELGQQTHSLEVEDLHTNVGSDRLTVNWVKNDDTPDVQFDSEGAQDNEIWGPGLEGYEGSDLTFTISGTDQSDEINGRYTGLYEARILEDTILTASQSDHIDVGITYNWDQKQNLEDQDSTTKSAENWGYESMVGRSTFTGYYAGEVEGQHGLTAGDQTSVTVNKNTEPPESTNYVYGCQSSPCWASGIDGYEGSTRTIFGDGQTGSPYLGEELVPLARWGFESEHGWSYDRTGNKNEIDIQPTVTAEELGSDYQDPSVNVEFYMEDAHGNKFSQHKDIPFDVDNSVPSASCSDAGCDVYETNDPDELYNKNEGTGYVEAEATKTTTGNAETCVTFNEEGVGIANYQVTGDTDAVSKESVSDNQAEFCVKAEAEVSQTAYADAEATGNETDEETDDPTPATDTVTESITIEITDYHDNTNFETITAQQEVIADAKAKAISNPDTSSCSGDTCLTR